MARKCRVVVDGFHAFAFHLKPSHARLVSESYDDIPEYVLDKLGVTIGSLSHVFLILCASGGDKSHSCPPPPTAGSVPQAIGIQLS